MSRKHTRRKHWGPANPIALAIDGACITDEARLDKLRTLELSALQAWTTGVASLDDWRTLADLSNLTQTLCEMGVGPEALPAAKLVEEVLTEANARYLATGRLGTTAPGLQAMRDLYEFHDLQRQSVDRSTYFRAIERTRNRIRSAHPSVKVLAGAAPSVFKEPTC